LNKIKSYISATAKINTQHYSNASRLRSTINIEPEPNIVTLTCTRLDVRTRLLVISFPWSEKRIATSTYKHFAVGQKI